MKVVNPINAGPESAQAACSRDVITSEVERPKCRSRKEHQANYKKDEPHSDGPPGAVDH